MQLSIFMMVLIYNLNKNRPMKEVHRLNSLNINIIYKIFNNGHF